MGVWVRGDVVGFHGCGERHAIIVDRVYRHLDRLAKITERLISVVSWNSLCYPRMGNTKADCTYLDRPLVLLWGMRGDKFSPRRVWRGAVSGCVLPHGPCVCKQRGRSPAATVCEAIQRGTGARTGTGDGGCDGRGVLTARL